MNVLFVDACVRAQSRTRTLCEHYLQQLEQKKDVTLLHIKLSGCGLQPLDEQMLMQRTEDIQRDALDQPAYRYAHQFADADLILIGAPYWDCSFPAILKVYLEHISVNRIAFAYAPDGQFIPLCRAQKLIYITTSGGYIDSKDSGEQYLRDLCAMYGIRDVDVIRAEGLDIYGNDPQTILSQAMQEIDTRF